MIIETSRFGKLEVDPDRLITFGDGILGFPDFHRYAMVQTGADSGFYWLQCVEAADLAFGLVDAFVGCKQIFANDLQVGSAEKCVCGGVENVPPGIEHLSEFGPHFLQSSTFLFLYVRDHTSWPPPLYSVSFALPPAFLIAAIMSRGRSTGTSGSASPWKAQIDSLASFSACAGSPPPLNGIAAANSSGLRETRSHVP